MNPYKVFLKGNLFVQFFPETKTMRSLHWHKNYGFGLIRRTHLLKLKDWRNEQIEHLRQKELLTDEDQIKWFKHIQRDNNQKLFALYQNQDNPIFIGYCGLVHIDWNHKRAEFSFLVETSRTKDIDRYTQDMLAAYSYMLHYAFEQANLHKVYTETYSFRTKHLKIIESLGFRQEGILRDHILIEDTYYNSIIHSLLHSEFTDAFLTWSKK